MAKAMLIRDDLLITLTEHGEFAEPGPFNERHAGLDHLGVAVADRATLDAWIAHLDGLGVAHGDVTRGATGDLPRPGQHRPGVLHPRLTPVTSAGMSSAYTHGHAESVLRSHRARTAANSAAYLLPHLQPGQRLLDVGAGPGTITADLARLVAPGRVTALETSDAVVALTLEGVEASGVENVDYLAGDVHALDLPDDSFDVVHAHQVLQHLPDPVQALREMVRVCRPGGVVAVRDADYSAFTWYPASPALDRWLALYLTVARANGGEPDAGRRLLAWAHAAGCEQVDATASVWCYADDDSRAAWGLGWADRILTSSVADQLLQRNLATPVELREISDAWRAWAADPDGWFTLLHGELIIHVVG